MLVIHEGSLPNTHRNIGACIFQAPSTHSDLLMTKLSQRAHHCTSNVPCWKGWLTVLEMLLGLLDNNTIDIAEVGCQRKSEAENISNEEHAAKKKYMQE